MLVCMEAQAARWMFHGGSPLQRERDTCRFAWCPCRFAWREQEVPTKDVAQIASCPVLWSQTFFAFHRRGVNLCCFDQASHWPSGRSARSAADPGASESCSAPRTRSFTHARSGGGEPRTREKKSVSRMDRPTWPSGRTRRPSNGARVGGV